MEKGLKNLQLATQKRGSGQRDSGVGMEDEDVADDKSALPEERGQLERPMPSIAEILQKPSN